MIALDGRPIELAVRHAGSPAEPRLIVNTTPPIRNAAERRRIRTILDRLLGLRLDLTGWYGMAARDARLQPLASRFRGVKPPRFPTAFEALINAFACQQLSLEEQQGVLN